MFNHLGWGEIAVLFVVGMFVFGPERLPKVAADLGRMLRELREMATGARSKLAAELGPEFRDIDLASLHPRTLVQKHLFDDDGPGPSPAAVVASGSAAITTPPPAPAPQYLPTPLSAGERAPYDPDAT